MTKRQRPNWSLSGISNGFPVLRSNMNPRLDFLSNRMNVGMTTDETLELPTQSWCPACPARLSQNSSWRAPTFSGQIITSFSSTCQKHLWLAFENTPQPCLLLQSQKCSAPTMFKREVGKSFVRRLSRKNICVWRRRKEDAAKQSENFSSLCEFLWNQIYWHWQ